MTGRNDGRATDQGRVYQASGDQHITEHHHHGAAWAGPDSVRHPPIGRAPAILRDRGELIERLKAAVTEGAGSTVFVLHGLGGCGKTAVACTLFGHATRERGRVGLWVNASDQASLRAGMLAVAADRGAGDGELMAARNGLRAAADLVWDRLDRSDVPWLLVLDNADDPAVLRDGGWLRTSPRGTVLVTTRQAAGHWWPAAELLHVDVLPREEAAQVLRDLAPGTGSAEDAAAIADSLGRLPLALTLAGGFLAHQVIDPWTMEEYGRRLQERPDPIELIDQGAVDVGGDSRHLVSGTWQLSLNSLAGQNLPEAVTLLRLLACWSNDPLPLSLLANVRLGPPLPLPAHRVELALRGLIDHSLTELVASDIRCLRTHGVLLDSVARVTPAGERDPLAAAAAGLLLHALPASPERGLRDSLLNALAPHVLGLLRRVTTWPETTIGTAESATTCALRLATAQHRSGDYASALAMAEQATVLARRRLGDDHLLVLRLRQRIGKATDRLGRLDEAAHLHRELLDDFERVCGPEALDTLTTCLHLSRPLVWLNRLAEALGLMHRAVAGRAAQLGPWHPLTLEARACLLELPPGPELDREAPAGPDLVADCRRELGSDHPITLSAELNCAGALLGAGRHTEALLLARRALAAHEHRFGTAYPITLAARSLLSNALHTVGEDQEAIEHAEVVREWRERVLGPEHPWTAGIRDKLRRYRSSLAEATRADPA
ncbi:MULTISPECIES: tetratricopeptide repeat protein [unclassified Streptomyces]|uniref:tetratricopeptide repeat protein n=1 Tax=unclassified Streptomyces TaxID=2593676 RepID=UPI00039E84BC|nr:MULTISPECIES: tetratricopeptide repeat protein [unclassified Streptomyces]MYY02688.1 tetratricopeptide repeat protein [Streptomyces sp. SID4913]